MYELYSQNIFSLNFYFIRELLSPSYRLETRSHRWWNQDRLPSLSASLTYLPLTTTPSFPLMELEILALSPFISVALDKILNLYFSI